MAALRVRRLRDIASTWKTSLDGFAKPSRFSASFSVASSDGPFASSDLSVRGWTDVARAGSDQPAHRALLGDVRAPADDARRGERRREERSRQADRVEQDRGVELDVGAQRALGMPLGEEPFGFALDGAREREPVRGDSRSLERSTSRSRAPPRADRARGRCDGPCP